MVSHGILGISRGSRNVKECQGSGDLDIIQGYEKIRRASKDPTVPEIQIFKAFKGSPFGIPVMRKV